MNMMIMTMIMSSITVMMMNVGIRMRVTLMSSYEIQKGAKKQTQEKQQ
jgi:hypothetical protein